MVPKCELMEITLKALNYTWSNGRIGKANVKERIGRVFINHEVNLLFPSLVVIHVVRGYDHCPLIVPFEVVEPKFVKIFKFESFWTESPTMFLLKELNDTNIVLIRKSPSKLCFSIFAR